MFSENLYLELPVLLYNAVHQQVGGPRPAGEYLATGYPHK